MYWHCSEQGRVLKKQVKLCDRKEFLLKLAPGIPVRKWRSIAVWLFGSGLGFAPFPLEAQSYNEAANWLSLFEQPRSLAGTDPEADEVRALSLYGRIGIRGSTIFFKDQKGNVPFAGYKESWSPYTRKSAIQEKETTVLYDALRPRPITSQFVSLDTIYRVVQKDSVIFIEKKHFVENGKWLRQLNSGKKKDREQLELFADDPRYVLERKGDKVDVWELTLTPAGFIVFETIVITGGGNTLKFYNGRPPVTGDEDDWTIKVERSGTIEDRLNYIEAQDAGMGWRLRQKSEGMGVRVSKGIVTMRAEVDSGRLYTASMTDESFIVNALVLFGRRYGGRSVEYDLDQVETDHPMHFKIGNFSLSLTAASKQ